MNNTKPSAADILEQYKWEPQPEAGRLVADLSADLFRRLPEAEAFAIRLRVEAGIRLSDIFDCIELWPGTTFESRVESAGFVRQPKMAFSTPGSRFVGEQANDEPASLRVECYTHPSGIFPAILINDDQTHRNVIEATIRVESLVDFAAVHGVELDGNAGALPDFRSAPFIENNYKAGLRFVERHGWRGFGPDRPATDAVQSNSHRHLERFRTRGRVDEELTADQSAEYYFDWAEAIVGTAISEVGRDRACDLFFAAEREFWQRRNRAAQIQKARQDRLGIGWANHDHHTYRSSRKHFSQLIAIWEKLGFLCRERFYAGREAGWGAQVMEQPNAGIVTFNDVDLSPDELLIDFAHEPLPERQQLGTVGLWCALHGESFLQAGMHHLECMFDFAGLREQLEREGVGVMKPFTDFPYLKQAFTQGERWQVREERIAGLLSRRQITEEQAAKFRSEGAIGSHLENLERNDGFKGFNQTGVSEIIAATDPRKQSLHH